MSKRILQTFLFGGVTLLTLLVVVYCLQELIPIDPMLAIEGDRISFRDVMRHEVHNPFFTRIRSYFYSLFQGNLGVSYVSGRSVAEELKECFLSTFELSTVAFFLGFLGGVPTGVFAACYPRSFWGKLVNAQIIFHSIPLFTCITFALLLFYARLGWVGGVGYLDLAHQEFQGPTGMILFDALLLGNYEVLASYLRHLVLPASILGFFQMSQFSRLTKVMVTDELVKPYIFLARAKGLSNGQVLCKHLLVNIAPHLLTLSLIAYATLLEGTVVTETIFSRPGLGSFLVQSITQKDTPALLGATLLIGALFIGMNAVAEILSSLFYPWERKA